MNKLAKSEDLQCPTVQEDMERSVQEGNLLPVVTSHVEEIVEMSGLSISNKQIEATAYALEHHNLTKEEVVALMRRFMWSPELRDCVKYSRPPMPRDFLDVMERHSDRSTEMVRQQKQAHTQP